VVEVLKIF
jgi:hypothetical protein